jgi:hypothetical protein
MFSPKKAKYLVVWLGTCRHFQSHFRVSTMAIQSPHVAQRRPAHRNRLVPGAVDM